MLFLLTIGLLNGGEPLRLLGILLLAAVEIALFLTAVLEWFRPFWVVGPVLLALVGGILLTCMLTVWRGWNAMGPLAAVAYELLGLALLGVFLGLFTKRRKGDA